MAIPEDVADGDPSHDVHHNQLHDLYNYVDGLADGRVIVGAATPGVGTDLNLTTEAWISDADDISDTSTTNKFTTAAEISKLAGIEAGATADQTGAQIKTAYEAQADTNAFDDAAAAKLAAIEALADVTDATNVNAAGAVMTSDTSTAGMGFVVDEDNMVSDSSTKVPTQQSVKQYVDNSVASAGGGDMLSTQNLADLQNAMTARANLGVAIGTNVQAYSSVLDTTTASFTTADETKLDSVEARANHTGTQTASTISDFNTAVRTNRLDQMAAPTAAVALNTQKITGLGTPTATTDAVTKSYVDDNTANRAARQSCRAVSTSNITLSGLQTIDGVTLLANERVLVTGQTTPATNGIYLAKTTAWTRATDFNTASNIKRGVIVIVAEGTTNADTAWVMTSNQTTYVVDTTALTWRRFDARNLADLYDVTSSGPSDAQVLAWNAANSDWRPTTFSVPAVLDEDDMASNSATAVPSQQSTKAYVDAEIAAIPSGTGTTRNTHAHSASGALSVTRAAADQYTTVTATADITGFTDNMSNGDLLRLIIKNGTAADYTADFSSINYLDDGTALPAAADVFETTVLALLLEKVEGTVYAVSFANVVAGAAQPGAALAHKATEFWAQSTPTARTLPGSPATGDRIIFGAIAIGPSGEAGVSWTAPTNGNAVNEVVESNTGTFHPRVKIWESTYDGSTSSFTFGYAEISSLQSVFMILVDGAGSAVRTSTIVTGVDSGSVTGVPAGSLNLAILAEHDNDKTYVSVPSGYTLGDQNLAESSTFRSGGAAHLVQASAGEANPGVWTLSATPSFAKAFVVVVDS